MKWVTDDLGKIHIKFIVSPEHEALSLLKSKYPMFSRMKMVACMESDLCSIFQLKLVAIDTVPEFLEIFLMHMRVKLYLRIWIEFRASSITFFKKK